MLIPFQSIFKVFFAYSIGHVLIDRLIIQHWLYKKRYHVISKYDQIFLTEKIASSINAIYVSTLAFKSIFIQQDYILDLMHSYPSMANKAFIHLCGYTMYDLITMWQQGENHWSMWIHHFMSLYGSGLIMYFRNPSYYPLLFTITEITAVFNNLVWYMNPKSRLVPILLLVRALAFTLCRVWVGPYALLRILVHADFDPFIFINQWFNNPKIHWIASLLTLTNTATLTCLNFGWTVAVWKLALRSLRSSKKY